VKAHHTVRTYGRNSVGDNSILLDNVSLRSPSTDSPRDPSVRCGS